MSDSPLDPRTSAIRPDLADERLRGRVAAERFAPGRPARIVAPCAPVRRRPAPDAPLDTEALRGERATIFDERDGYAWVQLASDGYVGYAPSSVLARDGAEPTHRVAALRSFVFPGPDIKRPPLAFLSLGAGVTPTGPAEAGLVPIEGGGWMALRHLRPVADREMDAVAVAERFLGTPYLWGGKTSLGLDCSGLVQVAFGASGTAVPRDSDMQAALGTGLDLAPDLSALRRGDLVFWRGHVGLMQDDTRLLHANGHHMAVASEPVSEAERRIRTSGKGPITGLRRLSGLEHAPT